MENPFAIGIDIGGSHITIGVIDLDRKDILPGSIQRSLVDSSQTADVIITQWSSLINKTLNHHQNKISKIIGIAIPGPFDYKNGIFLIQDQQKFNALYGVNIKSALADKLNIEEKDISFINDAAAFLQGEIFSNKQLHNKVVLGLTLGTGLGSAICFDEKAEDADLWNEPFMDGIAEDYLSSSWFINHYKKLTGIKLKGVKELAEKAGKDTQANKVFEEFGFNLAQFLNPLAKKYSVNTIIIGGNISGASQLFFPKLKSTLEENNININIEVARLKETAALIGAACNFTLVKNIS